MTMPVMLDLETMGTSTTAAIVAIGAVQFDPHGVWVSTTSAFSVNVDLQNCINVGLTVDGETVRWWMRQSEASRAALFDPEPIRLADALRMFAEWFPPDAELWSHATFDVPILGHAYDVLRQTIPWHYRKPRDLRTLTAMAWPDGDRPIGVRVPLSVAHCALDDAIHQARYAQEAVAILTQRRAA